MTVAEEWCYPQHKSNWWKHKSIPIFRHSLNTSETHLNGNVPCGTEQSQAWNSHTGKLHPVVCVCVWFGREKKCVCGIWKKKRKKRRPGSLKHLKINAGMCGVCEYWSCRVILPPEFINLCGNDKAFVDSVSQRDCGNATLLEHYLITRPLPQTEFHHALTGSYKNIQISTDLRMIVAMKFSSISSSFMSQHQKKIANNSISTSFKAEIYYLDANTSPPPPKI